MPRTLLQLCLLLIVQHNGHTPNDSFASQDRWHTQTTSQLCLVEGNRSDGALVEEDVFADAGSHVTDAVGGAAFCCYDGWGILVWNCAERVGNVPAAAPRVWVAISSLNSGVMPLGSASRRG